MKKLFLCLLFVFSLILLPACFSNSAENRVESITFQIDEGSVPPQFYSELDLVVTPNYDDRTLKLNYNLTYPERTEETDAEDVSSEGVVGGENFENFEAIVKTLEGMESDVPTEASFGGGTLVIDIIRADQTYHHIETGFNDGLDGVEEVQKFYLGLINLLTEEEKI